VSEYAVRRLEGEADLRQWDAFVAASPQANPFSTTSWLTSAAEAAGAEIEIWVAAKGESWFAGVALSTRRAGGRWHLGLPLASYNTFVYRPRASSHPESVTLEHLEVTHALIDGTRGRMKNGNLMLVPSITDVRPWMWSGWSARPRYTYVLDLSKPLPVSHSARKHLRKCQDAGMTLDSAWNLDALCSVFSATQERKGFAVRLSPERFRKLSEGLQAGGLATMLIARTAQGEPVSGHVLLSVPGSTDTFHWVVGTHSSYLTSGVSAWLMVETAAEMTRRGFRSWDLCGADFPSIARFKSNLGGTLVPYFQVEAPRGSIDGLYAGLKRLARGDGYPRR
jgi:hypothetical protein